MTKEVRATTDTFVGKSNTEMSRISMGNALNSKMSSLVSQGLISSDYSTSVTADSNDIANGVVKVSVRFKPIVEIEFIEIIETVEL